MVCSRDFSDFGFCSMSNQKGARKSFGGDGSVVKTQIKTRNQKPETETQRARRSGILPAFYILEELTFLEIDFFRKILVLALAGAQRGVNAVQRAF